MIFQQLKNTHNFELEEADGLTLTDDTISSLSNAVAN